MARINPPRCTSGTAAGEKPCNEKLVVQMVASGGSFRKSAAVQLCPRCDSAAHGSTLPPPQQTP